MRASVFVLALEAVYSLASPVVKKANYDPLPGGDIDILNYALTLEYLERKYYREGLANYTEADFLGAGFTQDFYKNFLVIRSDEEVRHQFL